MKNSDQRLLSQHKRKGKKKADQDDEAEERLDKKAQNNARKRPAEPVEEHAPKGKTTEAETKKKDKLNVKPLEERKRKAKVKASPKEKKHEGSTKAKPSPKEKKAEGPEKAKDTLKKDQAEGPENARSLPNGEEVAGPERKERKKNPQLVSKEDQAKYREHLGCRL